MLAHCQSIYSNIHQESKLALDACKMMAILFTPQCVDDIYNFSLMNFRETGYQQDLVKSRSREIQL